MKVDPQLDARLREIVVRHTVVGGYPDTMAIAREAYALERGPRMLLERTSWRGDVTTDEEMDLDAWIATAPDDMMRRLLDDDLENPAGQAFLSVVWNECVDEMDALLSSPPSAPVRTGVTYHWREGERRRLRQAVTHIRPGYLDPDPAQASLL